MTAKIDLIEIRILAEGEWSATIWRAFNDRFYGFDTATERSITPASLIRLHRAQLRLAGLPVSGWPWADYCECEVCYPDETGQVPICKHCGKEIEI